jgi:hypothetical protein
MDALHISASAQDTLDPSPTEPQAAVCQRLGEAKGLRLDAPRLFSANTLPLCVAALSGLTTGRGEARPEGASLNGGRRRTWVARQEGASLQQWWWEAPERELDGTTPPLLVVTAKGSES